MISISELRKEYTQASLNTTDVQADPLVQFEQWLKEAVDAQALEPTAMTLSTVGRDGRPAGRIVLLKGIEDGGFVFYTNYQSRKGVELDEHAACALTFFWPELERQVRVEGFAARVAEEKSVAYYQSRPLGSQVSAWASPQSAVIGSREILEERVKEIQNRFKGLDKLPKPKQWGGFLVTPVAMEFWQGRPSRLHDRLVYRLQPSKQWAVERLAP
jgi:pyridoxamine 5'-phosphate oxidase